jgi:hypothetical protein
MTEGKKEKKQKEEKIHTKKKRKAERKEIQIRTAGRNGIGEASLRSVERAACEERQSVS